MKISAGEVSEVRCELRHVFTDTVALSRIARAKMSSFLTVYFLVGKGFEKNPRRKIRRADHDDG
jgi:hypothetical protein